MRKLVFLTILLLTPHLHATTARFLPLPELVKRSDTVVHGHAIAQDTFWQGPRILTRVRFQVQEVWTGTAPKAGDVLDILTEGGIVGTIGQRVDGAAVLPVGGQLVLALSRDATGEYNALGMAQGVWLVRDVPFGALSVSRPNIDRLVGAPAGSTMPNTLAGLKQAVLEAAHAP